jgi:hypothetical protein
MWVMEAYQEDNGDVKQERKQRVQNEDRNSHIVDILHFYVGNFKE